MDLNSMVIKTNISLFFCEIIHQNKKALQQNAKGL
jgi:hypothetical protein